MTKEAIIREASRFLRTVYDGSISVAAEVLTAEAELLSGRDDGATQVLIDNLESVKHHVDYLIKRLKE